MIFELDDYKRQLRSFYQPYAKSIKVRDPVNWHPKSHKDVLNILRSFFNQFPAAKTYQRELTEYLKQYNVLVRTSEIQLKAKGKERSGGAGHKPWLTEERKIWNDINKNSQFANFREKTEYKLGSAFKDLDLSTDETLDDLEDPNRDDQDWEVRGMVVGDVQSGKTSNYTGLVAKAIDTGYKMIIVITGIHNSLRSQTQKRLEENIIHGAQSAGADVKKPLFLTSMPTYEIKDGIRKIVNQNDFNASTARSVGFTNLDPVVLVVKKNVNVLKNILIWLNKQKGIEKTDKELKWDLSKWKKDIDELPSHKLSCDKSLLIIDDECDNASIDISKRKIPLEQMEPEEREQFEQTDPSKTNQLIRIILTSFKKKAYVGYTATPLANIMIDYTSAKETEELDLFPRDFVKLLPRYDSHIGPEDVFGVAEKSIDPDDDVVTLSEDISADQKPQVKWVYDYRDDYDKFNDDEERDREYRKESKEKILPNGWMPLYHNKMQTPYFKHENTLTPSLKEAIKVFLINIILRELRHNKKDHNSMLIHVSRFKDVQNKVYSQVSEHIDLINKILTVEIDKNKKENLQKDFEKIWETEVKKNIDFEKYPDDKKINFSNIWSKLIQLLTDRKNPIDILKINSTSDDSLDYERKEKEKKAWNIIVIGGAAVSRGITLEGLNVSYFTRLAKLPTSDTLIQMGRWFGYRIGYEDLWRVYCPKQLHILFRQFSYVMERARASFEQMAKDRKSPVQFAFEIPCFPGWNLIAKNKGKDMGIVKEPYSSFFSSHHVPVVYFNDEHTKKYNIELSKKLIDSLGEKFETEKEINSYFKKEKFFIADKLKSYLDSDLPQNEIEKIIRDSAKTISLGKAFLWKNVRAENIFNYLNKYKMPMTTRNWSPQTLSEKIKVLSDKNKNLKWDVGIYSILGKKKDLFEFEYKKSVKLFTQYRRLLETNVHYPAQFSIKNLADKSSQFMGMTADEFNNAVQEWIKMYKIKKTTVSKSSTKDRNYMPIGFFDETKQNRKNGILILYPFTTNYLDQDFDKDNSINSSWELIIPKTATGEEEESLRFNLAYNRVRKEKYAADREEINFT